MTGAQLGDMLCSAVVTQGDKLVLDMKCGQVYISMGVAS
jgi:hypothetical protein